MNEGDNTPKEDGLKGFWIGPRMGRKKRNPKVEDAYRSPSFERDNGAEIIEAMQHAPWAFVAVKGKKRLVALDKNLNRFKCLQFHTEQLFNCIFIFQKENVFSLHG